MMERLLDVAVNYGATTPESDGVLRSLGEVMSGTPAEAGQ